jgi:molybdate transport system regulatory protein
MPAASPFRIKVQVCCGDAIAMGPGKADLLDAIAAHGSISAAARAMGMSYRRAWLLVDVMNRCWAGPLVETLPGGAAGRGAHVSPLGAEVLGHYRALQGLLAGQTASAAGKALAALLAPAPRPSQR